jgi:hypothetical protein
VGVTKRWVRYERQLVTWVLRSRAASEATLEGLERLSMGVDGESKQFHGVPGERSAEQRNE